MSGYSARVELMAQVMARREILNALGVVQPEAEWDDEFRRLIERAVQRTYPNHMRLMNEIDAVVYVTN
jgi:hypothetical protein